MTLRFEAKPQWLLATVLCLALDQGCSDDAPLPDVVVPGVCNEATPHGCYTLSPESNAGCPSYIPEIPTLYPFDISKWDLCSRGAVPPFTTCKYDGPSGARGACICDTGLHWICLYN